MPMSPLTVKNHQKFCHKEEVEAFSERIDRALLDDFDGEVFRWRDVPRSAIVREEIVAAYRRCGWDVEMAGNPRDGSYWEFRPREYEGKE